MPVWRPGTTFAPLIFRAAAADRTSIASVLFPEPETPHTTVRFPRGKRASTCFRLFSVAPRTVRNFFPTGFGRRHEARSARPER